MRSLINGRIRLTSYGFGDSATWAPYLGHPNDPRAPDDEELVECSACADFVSPAEIHRGMCELCRRGCDES